MKMDAGRQVACVWQAGLSQETYWDDSDRFILLSSSLHTYIYMYILCTELVQILIYHFVALTAEMSHKARKCLFQVEKRCHTENIKSICRNVVSGLQYFLDFRYDLSTLENSVREFTMRGRKVSSIISKSWLMIHVCLWISFRTISSTYRLRFCSTYRENARHCPGLPSNQCRPRQTAFYWPNAVGAASNVPPRPTCPCSCHRHRCPTACGHISQTKQAWITYAYTHTYILYLYV